MRNSKFTYLDYVGLLVVETGFQARNELLASANSRFNLHCFQCLSAIRVCHVEELFKALEEARDFGF